MKLWNSFGVHWVLPDSVNNLVKAWVFPFRGKTLISLWTPSLPMLVWNVWKERNRHIFQEKKMNEQKLFGTISIALRENLKEVEEVTIYPDERKVLTNWGIKNIKVKSMEER